MTTTCWLKIEPAFNYSHRQLGWKVVGVTQSQPKNGHAIRLTLDIPPPSAVSVDIEPADVSVLTQTDINVQEVVDGLGEGV